jgi:hypothetical protein
MGVRKAMMLDALRLKSVATEYCPYELDTPVARERKVESHLYFQSG